jgi:hypothetical protein
MTLSFLKSDNLTMIGPLQFGQVIGCGFVSNSDIELPPALKACLQYIQRDMMKSNPTRGGICGHTQNIANLTNSYVGFVCGFFFNRSLGYYR